MKQTSFFMDDGPSKYLHSQVIVYFQECWKREKGGGARVPVITWKRDSSIIHDLLKIHPGEYVEKLIRIYLTRQAFREDAYCVQCGWDIPSFLRRINRCIAIEAEDRKHEVFPKTDAPKKDKPKMTPAELRAHLEKVKAEP